MSLPEALNMIDAVGGPSQQSIAGPEEPSVDGAEASPVQSIELLRAEIVNLRIQLDEARIRLLYFQICCQSEAHGRQSETQIHHILQRGIDALQNSYLQLAIGYKSTLSQYDRKIAKQQEDIRIGEELIARQEELIGLHEARDRQQQQPASHLVESGPLLTQYPDHYASSRYPSYQPPPGHQFIIDPTRLHPLDDLDYSIGPAIEPGDTDAAASISTPVAECENRAPILPVQAVPYSTLAEHDTQESNFNKDDGTKRLPEDGGARPNKKRKTK